MIAVISGSTGLTGTSVLKKLLDDKDIKQVISVTRKPVGMENPKLTEVFLSDLSEIKTLSSSLKGDIYFCCLGTTRKAAGSKENFIKVDHDAIVAFGEIAKKHNAKSFSVISAMGVNKNSTIFYNQVKGRTEDDLQNLGLTRLVIFRPSFLIGDRKEFRFGENLATKILVPIASVVPGKVKRLLLTEIETLARQMVVEAKKENPGVFVFSAVDITN